MMQGFAPPPPAAPAPNVKRRYQRRGLDAVSFRLERIGRSLRDRPGQAYSIITAVAIGVAIAIAIIAASNGIDHRINDLLGTGHDDAVRRAGIDIDTIHSVLNDTRGLLTNLAIAFTAALVSLVTWTSMTQRRREIAIYIQQGMVKSDIIVELLGASLILCCVGGVVGIVAGLMVCNIIGGQIPNLPMSPDSASISAIFPTTTILSFLATAAIGVYFVQRPSDKVGL